ncbi:MAG: 30S ribosomal protein S4 [Flavobacteriaceae bacterium]|nr:30S ribosomal protein S4 [Flavobacteriaceae bacterium]
MARYTGPTTKIARKLGAPIFKEDKAYEKRPYPPGQHGSNRRRPKKSEYAIQLMEKQKAKFTYGILEKQFRNLFKVASRSKGVTGEELLRLCESRLDNVVFRLGLSTTRQGARQLVTHRHIVVNGQVVNIPSFTLRPGDLVGVRERSKSLEVINNSLSDNRKSSTDQWLVWNPDSMQGTFVDYPTRDQIPENIKEQFIVELYSK